MALSTDRFWRLTGSHKEHGKAKRAEKNEEDIYTLNPGAYAPTSLPMFANVPTPTLESFDVFRRQDVAGASCGSVTACYD